MPILADFWVLEAMLCLFLAILWLFWPFCRFRPGFLPILAYAWIHSLFWIIFGLLWGYGPEFGAVWAILHHFMPFYAYF